MWLSHAKTSAILLIAVISLGACERDDGDQRGARQDDPPPSTSPHSGDQTGVPPKDQRPEGEEASPEETEDTTQPDADSPIFDLDTAIQSKAGHYFVRVEWVSGPDTNGQSRCRLVFSDAAGYRPQTVEDVSFTPWMTVHDHGAPMRAQRLERDPSAANAFFVSGINFIMGGPWDLLITASVNAQHDEATAATEVP